MVKIRRLSSQDIEEVIRIQKESFTMPWSFQAFSSLLEEENSYYLVAEMENKVVGCSGFTNILGEGHINNVVVDKKYRNQKVGTKLMEALIKLGYEMGLEEFTLEVRVSNISAIKVYEKIGLKSEGIRPNFYDLPKEDAMIMWKRKEEVRKKC